MPGRLPGEAPLNRFHGEVRADVRDRFNEPSDNKADRRNAFYGDVKEY